MYPENLHRSRAAGSLLHRLAGLIAAATASVVLAHAAPATAGTFTAFCGETSTPTYSAAVLSDNPWGYWRLCQSTASTGDSSGNAHALSTSTSVSFNQTGALANDTNKAIRYWGWTTSTGDPTGNRTGVHFGTGFSLETWFKPTTSRSTDGGYIRDALVANGTPGSYLLGWGGGHNGFVLRLTTSYDSGGCRCYGYVDAYSTYPITAGTWYHLVGTWDGQALRLFVNGVLVGESSAATMYANNQELRFPYGAWGQPDSQGRTVVGTDGTLDEVAIYDHPISYNRVRAHYTASGRVDPTPAYATLAAKFRPKLYFDSGERWRPLDVDSFLTETVDSGGMIVPYHKICDGSGCQDLIGGATALADHAGAGAYIDINGNAGNSQYTSPDPLCVGSTLLDCDTGATSVLYYHGTGPSPGGYTYLDYWAFYRYNDAPSSEWDHEGDWEGLTVAPSKTDPDTFDLALFRQHAGAPFSYLRENLRCDGGGDGSCGSDSTKSGTRVHGYVANGTHATYAEPCTTPCTQTNSIVPESDHDGSTLWGRDSEASALAALPAAADPGTSWTAGPKTWVDWPGMWGDSGSPSGPAAGSHRDTFFEPWTSAQCADFPCALPSSKRSRRAILSDCRTWFAPDVTAVACEAGRLRRAIDHAGLGRPGRIAIQRGGRRAASAPGVAQLVGGPVRPGERLVVHAPREIDSLLIRARTGSRSITAVFRKLPTSAGHGAVVKIERRHGRFALVARVRGQVISPRFVRMSPARGIR